MGEVLGQVYVQQYFLPEQKAKTLQMVQDIEDADGIATSTSLDWMTRADQGEGQGEAPPGRRQDRLSRQVARLFQPSRSSRAMHWAIRCAHGAFEANYQLAKIGKPVDRGEWDMSPPTVNAYYNPSMNDINFPAGILQPAFYDKNAARCRPTTATSAEW